jgi:hypothetical protein
MQTVALALSLSLPSGANVGKRKHSSGFCIPPALPPPFYYPIFENLNDFRVDNRWRQLIFFVFSWRDFASFWPQIFIRNFLSLKKQKSTIFLGNEFSEKISFCYNSSLYQGFVLFFFGFCDIVTLATIHKKD